jgi:signal transduction histidine kinase
MLSRKLPPLKLLHSGLLLIGAVLSLELGFMALLTYQLYSADKELWAQLRAYHCAAAANQVVEHFYRASNELFAYGVLHRQNAKERYERAVSDMRRHGELTWMLMKTHPESSSELLHESYMLSKKALTALDDVKRTFDRTPASGLSALDLRRIVGKVKDTLQAYFETLSDVAAKQTVSRQEKKQTEFAWRRTIRILILSGFGLNAAMSVAAVMFWIKGVINRVDILVEDAHRIGRGETLLPLSEGEDELGDLERVLHEVNERLKHADLEKKEFIALISHELRAPLTAIGMTLTLLQEGVFGTLSDTAQERMRSASVSSKRLLTLINEMLDVHKMEAGKSILRYESVDIRELVEIAVAEVDEVLSEKQIEITVSLASQIIYVDPERIGQVLSKLLVNAIDRSESGASIELETLVADSNVEVRIVDRGLPVEGDVFSRFDLSGRSEDISGAGLLICKGIVAQHGGTIGVNNMPGSTAFEFTLPIAATEAEGRDRTGAAEAS